MASNSTINLNGRVEKTDIPTLLRSVEKDKLSGELKFVRRDKQRIDLYFLFGQLYHSEWGDTTGIDAVSELLSWKEGTYSFTEGVIPTKASINDDIDRILSTKSPAVAPRPTRQAALPPAAEVAPVTPPPSPPSGFDLMHEPAPFDLASLSNVPATNSGIPRNQATASSTAAPAPNSNFGEEPVTSMRRSQVKMSSTRNPNFPEPSTNDRIAPAPPANGLYRTQFFCLPTGEQMATSLVATGQQLQDELTHLADVGFTGYVLGGPEIEGSPAVGIAFYRGRFIHAFYNASSIDGINYFEGEKAYHAALDQRNQDNRFYWFYEIPIEIMRSAISLLTPPSRYSHLEVRIVRFKELLNLLREEMHTGCVRIIIPSSPKGMQSSPLSGDRAYLPIFEGDIKGVWTEFAPKLSNDGQLLQRFLAEPDATLDLHTTAPVAEPGIPFETLVAIRTGDNSLATAKEPTTNQPSGSMPPPRRQTAPLINSQPPAWPETHDTQPTVSDDERQMLLITSISRMESTWTQMQRKEKIELHASLLALAGFVNEILSLNENVSGRRLVQDMLTRAMKQELAPFRNIFQSLDITSGRVNIIKLLKEYDNFLHEGEQTAQEYYREAGRGMRALIRSAFQNYVSLIRKEVTRFECQEMFEVFLNDVVKRI